MFGRSKPPKPAKSNNAGLDMGFDMDPALMNMDMDMGDVDIDDAELQAELLALEGGAPAAASGTKAPKKQASKKGNIANADVDYTQVLHDTGGDVLMGDVTADDFDDADLMAEFAAIGGDPEELKTETKAKAKAKPPAQRPSLRAPPAHAPAPEKRTTAPAPEIKVQPVTRPPNDSATTGTTTTTSLNDHGEGEDEHKQALGVANQLSVVKKRQTTYRKGAIAANKASNKPLALACMKIMKYMDPLIEQLQAGITVDLSQLPQPYEEVADELAEQAAKHAAKQESANTPAAAKAQGATNGPPASRTAQPPPKATRANTSAAQTRPISAGENETPAKKTMTRSVQDVQAQAILQDCDSSGDIYDELISQVTEQHNQCSALARQLLKQGDKAQAVSFHSLSKAFDADRKRLAVAKQHNHIPQFHREERVIRSERSFPELSPNQLELVILEVKGIPKDLVGNSMSIDFEFPYPSDEVQKGTTKPFKGSAEHTLNHVERITIGRNKVFGRVVARPKYLTLTLKYKKFFGTKEVGTAKVSLGALQNKSEIHEQVEFCVDRKSVGCLVNVRMRIRQPLEGKDTQQEAVNWVFVDSTTPIGSRPVIPAVDSTQSAPSEAVQPITLPPKQPQHKSPQPKSPQPQPTAAKTAPSATSATSAKVDPYADGDTTGDPTSVSGIISNSVLEWMAEDAQKTASDCKRSGKPQSDELEDRIIAINTAMQLLVMQIQSGALDIEEYLQALREAVGRDKGLAIMLKKKGKTQWAVAAMKRVKLMMAELKDSDPNEPDIPATPYHTPDHTARAQAAPPVTPAQPQPQPQTHAQAQAHEQEQSALDDAHTTPPTPTQQPQPQSQAQSLSPHQSQQHTVHTPQPYVTPNSTHKTTPTPPTKPPQSSQPRAQQQQQQQQQQPTQPPQKKNSVDPEGDFEGDPMDVAGHVSNEVLEWEVNNCAKAIAAAKAKGQEPDNDILQKKQTAEVMMQVLIIQIQTEKLSLEDYCAQVKTKIVAEKKLAAKLKAKGKIEWAKAALMRAKIMEKEMEE